MNGKYVIQERRAPARLTPISSRHSLRRRIIIHPPLEVLPHVETLVRVLQQLHRFLVHRQRHLLVRHLRHRLVAHVLGNALCMVAVNHVRHSRQRNYIMALMLLYNRINLTKQAKS